MNQRCAPSRGGCGTWFTVGAPACPHCQKAAGDIGMLNIGAAPAVHGDVEIGEQGPEDVSDLVTAGSTARESVTNKSTEKKSTGK